MKLSDFSNRIYGQPMFKMLTKTQGLKNIIHLELGDPDFDTPGNVVNATIKSLKAGETHYTNSMGLLEMREAVQYTTNRTRGFKPDIEQILITPGANFIIYLVMACLLNPEDEVIIPDPAFPTYFSVARMLQLKDIHIRLKEENRFHLKAENIAKKITSKTKLIIINSPSNPTGAVMTADEIDKIYYIAQKNDIYILSDEIYSRMIYDKLPFHTPSKNDFCKKRTIVLNGFSKAFAMTGWRLGVAIGPHKLISKMGLLLQTLCSCVPPFIQRGGIEAIYGSQKRVNEMMDIYSVRRENLWFSLKEIPNIKCHKGEGGFYLFPNISQTGMTSNQFADFALKQGVALLPGTNFGKYGEGYVRLTYASKVHNLLEGVKRLDEGLQLRN